MNKKFTLDSIAYYPLPSDFTFIIGDATYQCNLIQILAISGEIQQQYQQNPSINSYKFEKLKDPFENFSLFIDLLNGCNIELSIENSILLYNIGLILDIPYLINEAGKYATPEITDKNALEYCQLLFDHGVDYEKPALFIAANWDLFSHINETMDLSVEILDTIIQIDGFKVSSETELFEWIENLVNVKGRQYIRLFGHVIFSKLRRHHMKHLVDILSQDSIDPFVWQELDERLTMEVNPDEVLEPSEDEENSSNDESQQQAAEQVIEPQSEPIQLNQPIVQVVPPSIEEIQHQMEEEDEFNDKNREESYIDLSYEPDYRLNGVISYIKNQLGSNYTDAVIATGGGTKVKKIGNIFDYDETKTSWWDNFDLSINRCTKENAWCMIELKGYVLCLQAYTLASPANRLSFHQPKSWRIEVSNDGVNFITVHEVNKCQEMNTQYPILTFQLPETGPIRFVKLVLLENYASSQSNNQFELSLSAFELYGKLRQL